LPEATAESVPSGDSSPLDLENVRRIWPEALAKVPYKYNWRLSQVEPVGVAEPNILVVAPKPGYNGMDEAVFSSETADVLGATFQRLMKRPVQVRFRPSDASDGGTPDRQDPEPRRADALASDPLVQKVIELFEARPVQMDYDGPDEGASA
jgi:DNA polymerase-3 subunit gamma/tau